MAKTATYKYSYTGSVDYSFSNVVMSDKNKLLSNNKLRGLEGIDAIPYDGSTVTMTANANAVSGQKDFEPSANNKMYWLITNDIYSDSDYDTFISLATEVLPVFDAVANEFVGQFVFTNPNNFKELYMIWDYRDNLGTGAASHDGSDFVKYLDVEYGSDIGRAGVGYEITDVPVRVKVQWKDVVVADTGYVGLNSLANYNDLIAAGVVDDDINLSLPYDGTVNNGTGSIYFNKYTTDSAAIIKIETPLSTASIKIETVVPSLNSFYIETVGGTLADVCNQCPTTQYYHNGSQPEPVIGDIIFTNSDGSTAFVGRNGYHLMDSVACAGAPISDGIWLLIDENGRVLQSDTCNCQVFAPPVITPVDYEFKVNDYQKVALEREVNALYAKEGKEFFVQVDYVQYDSETEEYTVDYSYESKDCTVYHGSVYFVARFEKENVTDFEELD